MVANGTDSIAAITQAVVLCGGLGTRLGSLVHETPKPMLPVGGRPVLNHTIQLLKQHGINEIIFAAQYKSDVIEAYFGDGTRYGIKITTSVEPYPLGTAGPLTLIAPQLHDDFLLVYGDVFMDFDVGALIRTHETKTGGIDGQQRLGTLLVRQSDHPWDSHLVQTDAKGRVIEFIAQQEPGRRYKNLGNAAVYALSKKILEFIPTGRKSDFGKDIFPAIIAEAKLHHHSGQFYFQTHLLESSGFVKDMGTPERLAAVERYLERKHIIEAARGRHGPITTVFLDRDGVLNKEVDLLSRPEQLELMPDAAQAVKLFNQHGIKIVVVTNQPVVARGLCSMEMLNTIHEKLISLLEKDGAALDAIYACPHHPETHHEGGVRELRRACDCRKPNIGMIMRAREELGLGLSNCVMIGDSTVDVETGRNAGIRTVLLRNGQGRIDDDGARPDFEYQSLLAAAKAIVEGGMR
jgi:histidinol-phosphate phosphatase family protein